MEGADRRGQPEACVIFKGMGTGITEEERQQYHKSVSVHFNKSAWVNDEFAMKWVEIFKDYPGVAQAKDKRKAIICFFDNLGAQTRGDFKRELLKHGIFAHYYPEGMTDLVQAVDGGVGSALKAAMSELLSQWLAQVPDPAFPEVTNNTRMGRTKKEGGHVSVSEQRILCTNLLGQAWDDLCGKMNFFELGVKLGNVMKIDDLSHENEETCKIKLQGVPKYSFKDEDAMWGEKPVVAGAAEEPKPTAAEVKEAKKSAAQDAWENEEGGSEVGSGDDGSDDSIEEEERLPIPVGFFRGDYSDPDDDESDYM
jgi:hypothetical protein